MPTERSPGKQHRFGARVVLSSAFIPIAFTKWGSNLGYPSANLYLEDLLFIGGASLMLLSSRGKKIPSGISRIRLLLFLVFLYAVFRLMTVDSPLSLRLRDSAPIIYLLFIPIYVQAIARVGMDETVNWIKRALAIHLIWLLPVALGLIPRGVKVGPITIFTGRGDVDAIFCGLAATMLAWSVAKDGFSWPRFFGILGNTLIVLLYGNRAALLSVLACTFLILQARAANSNARYAVRLLTLYVSIALGGAIALAISARFGELLIFQRLGFIESLDGQAAARSATNTILSRFHAWSALWSYTIEPWNRFLFGAGPGSDTVGISGARVFLSGNAEVRAPHNSYLFLIAQFGVTGLLLWGSVVTGVLLHSRSAERDVLQREEYVVPMLFISSILVGSFFGVVLEAPFGSIPLALCLAVLLILPDSPCYHNEGSELSSTTSS